MNDPGTNGRLSLYDNSKIKTDKGNNNNNNDMTDDVFAKVTDMFGDMLTSDVIFSVCTNLDWKLEDCIEHLIQATAQQTNESEKLHSQHVRRNSNDMDIVIESEEDQFNIADTSKNLSLPEQGLCNIELETSNTLNNQRQSTYSGAIKKTSRQINNFIHIADVPNSTTEQSIRSNFKTRMPVSQFYDRPHLQKIANQINEGFKVMVIMRGAPGCGKSYLAREIIDATTCDQYGNHIFSSDNFFYDQRGNYNFNSYRIGEAHDWNKAQVDRFARDGWSPIIVDNTNIRVWELNNYLQIAVRYGYIVQIVEPNTSWSRSAGKLAIKNCHNVPKESIERMLSNYELTTVAYAMEGIGLKPIVSPQYRLNPPLPRTETVLKSNQHDTGTTQAPKPQRSFNSSLKVNNFQLSNHIPDVAQYGSLEEAFEQVQKSNQDWTTFEQERTQFWNATSTPAPLPLLISKSLPKRTSKQKSDTTVPSMDTKDQVNSNLFALLKRESEKSSTDDSDERQPSDENEPKILYKHRKHCKNENSSFAQIRQIYPSVPLEFLWDLFEKCEGDGDWTMDILLKEETRIGDYEKLDSDVDRGNNDFHCHCDRLDSEILIPKITTPLSTYDSKAPSNIGKNTNVSRRDRSMINNDEQLVAKRMIEENFKIGDQHYSEHTRKIRNLRRGVNADAIVESVPNEDDQNGACAIDIDETEQNEEEILEMNLGIEFVCQLDTFFGIEAYQREAIKDLKTNVFMPKSLAQQLYALWLESLYNQLEEQRQKSIKEDAEFAKQLQSQQNYPGLYKQSKPPTDIKDIIEMEYAWAAYKTEVDDWRSRTPQDLAAQMTHDKLCEIFPNVERETLIEVLVAHNNKFAETVDVLKDTLKDNVMDMIESDGRELFEQARAEVETTAATDLISSTSIASLENKKLGPDEAKRTALKEFEECRNLAMHHTQLKAECYSKAKDAIQRKDTSVALYYSQIANLHKNKIDMYNHKAANCIMEVHNLTQNNPDMLDLHYLHVNEAVECLDLFLDQHITKLKTLPQTYKYIFVITGRGLHSTNGISTIKQKVKNRFRERHLTWSEVNPGLLKVKIFTNSRLTVNLNGYLDDGTLGDEPELVLEDVKIIIDKLTRIGIKLNPSKCEILVLGVATAEEKQFIYEALNQILPGITTKEVNINLLAPLTDNGISTAIQSKISKLKLMVNRMDNLNSHQAYFLMRHSLSIPQLTYLLRTTSCWHSMDDLLEYDLTSKRSIEKTVNCRFDKNAWIEATNSVQFGGLGLRNATDLCYSSFLGSYYSVSDLLITILQPYILPSTNLVEEALSFWQTITDSEILKVDEFGLHGLCCKKSIGRKFRHEMINDIIKRALATGGIPSIREPSECFRSDGKKPDGLTLTRWKNGKPSICDFTCSDTLAKSYVKESSKKAGDAAAKREDAKRQKYECLENDSHFIPVAIDFNKRNKL